MMDIPKVMEQRISFLPSKDTGPRDVMWMEYFWFDGRDEWIWRVAGY